MENQNQNPKVSFTEEQLLLALEIVYVILRDDGFFDFVAKELDLSDDELNNLNNEVSKFLNS